MSHVLEIPFPLTALRRTGSHRSRRSPLPAGPFTLLVSFGPASATDKSTPRCPDPGRCLRIGCTGACRPPPPPAA